MNSAKDDFGRAGEVVLNLSDEEMEAVSGGAWTGGDEKYGPGDAREDVDPDLAHADFVNGAVDGGELD